MEPYLGPLKKFESLDYQQLREDRGHLGADRRVSLARERFFWPKMREENEQYGPKVFRNRKEHPCKALADQHLFRWSQLITCGTHFGNCTLNLTKYAQACAIPIKSGKTAARKIFDYLTPLSKNQLGFTLFFSLFGSEATFPTNLMFPRERASHVLDMLRNGER